MKIKQSVLCFLLDQQNRLLMIYKKRGQGTGKWNVPGGKLEAGESIEQAVLRETEEETGLVPVKPQKIGTVEFYFPEGNCWDNICSVFIAYDYSGDLLEESEECFCKWVPKDKIPFEDMWESDKIWVPLVLAEKPFHRIYHFNKADRMILEIIR